MAESFACENSLADQIELVQQAVDRCIRMLAVYEDASAFIQTEEQSHSPRTLARFLSLLVIPMLRTAINTLPVQKHMTVETNLLFLFFIPILILIFILIHMTVRSLEALLWSYHTVESN